MPLDADQIVEHPVGGLKHILHSLVVDVHGGEEQLRGKFPEAHIGAFGDLRVDDSNWYFKGISRVNFLP